MKQIPYRTYIRCYANAETFEAPLRREGAGREEVRTTIAYFAGKGIVNIRNGTCRRARLFANRALVTTETASAMSTILHETLHRQGIRDERITECFANDDEVRGLACALERARDQGRRDVGRLGGDRNPSA